MPNNKRVKVPHGEDKFYHRGKLVTKPGAQTSVSKKGGVMKKSLNMARDMSEHPEVSARRKHFKKHSGKSGTRKAN